MKFIDVRAVQCNSQGLTRGVTSTVQFFLNIDLIAAFEHDTIRLKGGDILIMGGSYYKDLHVANREDLQKLKL